MDARFPDRWLYDRRIARSTDSQFRLFVNANAWAVSNRTDGHIPADDLSLIPRANTADAAALVSLGLWNAIPDGWMIEGFLTVQTSKSQLDGLDHKRATQAEASKAYRKRQKTAGRGESYDSSYDDKGQDRTGKALYGENDSESETVDLTTGEVQPKTKASPAPASVPASLKSAAVVEAIEQPRCPECTDPLPPGGVCLFCGPAKEPITW